MVKHGRDKKRRAGRIGKTKLKNRTWTRYDPNPKVNSVLKPIWDPSKTPAANLMSIGLVADPNKSHIDSTSSRTAANSHPNSKPVIELFDIPDSDGICRDRNNKKQQQYPLSIDEEEYVIKCMNKYGTNYTKMFRDIKINTMQHTEEKLRKLCTRYILLSPEQRRIQNISEKIQQITMNNDTNQVTH